MPKTDTLACCMLLYLVTFGTLTWAEGDQVKTVPETSASVPGLPGTQAGTPASCRQVRAEGKKLLVDGKPFYVKGVSYLSHLAFENLSPAEIEDRATLDLAMIRDMGLNTIIVWPRTPPIILDIAEQYQLQIIEQVVHIGSETNFASDMAVFELLEEVRSVVRRDMKRPNLLMWRAWNDAPFKWGKGGEPLQKHGLPKVEAVLEKVVSAIRETDATHPVLGSNMLNCDFWYIGLQHVDVIGVNYYLGIVDWFDGKFSPRAASVGAEQLENIGHVYRKPLLLTETGYSTICSSISQADAIAAQMGALVLCKN